VMEEEELFRQEKLGLAELATRLDLSPHQLSEAINLHAGCSYNDYLNRLRLQAVCKALLETPQRSVLDIALDCGFGSRSSFNSVFVREIGATPFDFRRSHSAAGGV
jgi:transcriptional regulator GlxA family with amidase domain